MDVFYLVEFSEWLELRTHPVSGMQIECGNLQGNLLKQAVLANHEVSGLRNVSRVPVLSVLSGSLVRTTDSSERQAGGPPKQLRLIDFSHMTNFDYENSNNLFFHDIKDTIIALSDAPLISSF